MTPWLVRYIVQYIRALDLQIRELEFQIQNSFKKPSTVYIFVISALEPRDRWISAACQSVSLAGNSEFLVQNLPERGREKERKREREREREKGRKRSHIL